ncbi:MAG: DUF4421 family protein [Bacteroidaceae bacterium]|nr:DUF4421 family protein [Bacteroidaceae bacterium]
MKRLLICSCLTLTSLVGYAQLDVNLDIGKTSQEAQTQSDKGIKKNKLFKQAQDFVDKKWVKNVDTLYIQNPDQVWRISLDSYLSQSDLLMKSTIDGTNLGAEGDVKCKPRIRTDVSTSVGVRVGYKGLAAHYAFNVAGDKGRDFSLSSSGTWYCVHFRLHEFKTKEPQVHYEGDFYPEDGGDPERMNFANTWALSSPIKAKTMVLDGYYIFNKRRFSYKAAYRQSVIQKRSAGSWLAGAMFYYSDFRFDDVANAQLILNMGNMGRIKQWEANLGAGYGYNYVPAKGWLISAMAMPMLTFYNRMKIYNYDSYVLELAQDDEYHDPDEVVPEDRWLREMGTDAHSNRIRLNFNARLSLTYNFGRYFVNLNGQFYNFGYHHKGNSGRLNDWFANAAIGVRL